MALIADTCVFIICYKGESRGGAALSLKDKFDNTLMNCLVLLIIYTSIDIKLKYS